MRLISRSSALELSGMVTISQIREHLVDLLASKENREDVLSVFEDWLVKASWNMHLTSDIRAQKFAADIQLNLAEMDAENLDYDLLWDRLKDLLSAYSLSLSEGPVTISSSSTTFKPQEWAFSPFGSQRAVACGSPTHR